MAANRALHLPDILVAVFEQLYPDEHPRECHVIPSLACNHGEAAAATACLAALGAAARVSRLWFGVAVPILWRRPRENALSDDVMPDAARRAFYAKHIREVRLTHGSALWRALALLPASSDNDEGDRDNADNDREDEDGSGRGLRLPKLGVLHVPSDYRATLHDQSPLLRLVSPALHTLSCHLAPELVDQLEAIYSHISRHNAAAAAADTTRPVQKRHMRLRNLVIYGHLSNSRGSDVESQERLLAWIGKSRSIVPLLARVEFIKVVLAEKSSWALNYLGRLGTLKDLTLRFSHERGSDNPGNRIIDAETDILGHHTACGPESCYCRLGLGRPSCGFEGVRGFETSLGVRKAPSLVALMPSLTRLSIQLLRYGGNGNGGGGNNNLNTHDLSVARALEALAGLSQLQTLYLSCWHHFTAADMRLLHGLKPLQSLRIYNDAGNRATDHDVAALFRALPQLHTLRYYGMMPFLSHNALWVIGSASALIRDIELPLNLTLPPVNERLTPLFPSLEILGVHPLELVLTRFLRSVLSSLIPTSSDGRNWQTTQVLLRFCPRICCLLLQHRLSHHVPIPTLNSVRP
jgi:hypothetical protein